MSRPRYWWYGNVKRAITRYKKIRESPEGLQAEYVEAIEKALDDAKEKSEGDRRVIAIKMVLLDGTHTIRGASVEVGYSERVIQKWISEYVYAVGENVGFKCAYTGHKTTVK